MKNISVTYNSFVTLTDVKIDGLVLKPHTEEAEFLDRHRQLPVFEWLGKFVELLYGKYRAEICVSFAGTKNDCETFKSIAEEMVCSSATSKVKIGKIESTLPDPLNMLDRIYKKGKAGPFPEIFNDAETEKAYKRAATREFEVSVIAAMSSGKSTLMNALLGQNLMPSAADACTATIVRITDVDSMKGQPFVAVRYAADGTVIDKSPMQATNSSLIEWNKDKNIPRIEIMGDVPTISETPSAQYVFQDTPGPNNAEDPEHGEMTMRAISKPLSMVLYVMKPDTFQGTDNDNLFDKVRSAVLKADKNARNRFIFVLNQIDTIKPKEQSIEDVYKKAYANLESNGILSPIVIPVSARAAFLMRMHRYDTTYFDENEEDLDEYNTVVGKFERDRWNMYEVCKSLLSPSVQKEYERRLAAARGDKEELALLHTGIPLLETILQEYLYRYALPTKVGDALKTFKRVFDEADKASEIKSILSMKEGALRDFAKELREREKSNADLKRGEAIIREIGDQKYSLSGGSKDELDDLSAKYEEALDDVVKRLGTGKIGVDAADLKCRNARGKLDGLVAEVKEKLAEVLDREQHVKIGALVEKYNECLKNSLGGMAPALRKFQTEMLAINSEDIVQEAKNQSGATIAHTYYERRWYTLWCYKHEVTNYEKAIDMGKVATEVRMELADFCRSAIASFKKQAEEAFKKNQQLVIGRMGELQKKLSETAAMIQRSANNRDRCKEECERLQEHINWCESFQQELAGILKTA